MQTLLVEPQRKTASVVAGPDFGFFSFGCSAEILASAPYHRYFGWTRQLRYFEFVAVANDLWKERLVKRLGSERLGWGEIDEIAVGDLVYR